MENESRKFEDTDLIEVMNISQGKLIYAPRFREDKWIFEKPGDTCTMTWAELKTMRSAYSQFFRNKWLKVLDDDAVTKLRIRSYYED